MKKSMLPILIGIMAALYIWIIPSEPLTLKIVFKLIPMALIIFLRIPSAARQSGTSHASHHHRPFFLHAGRRVYCLVICCRARGLPHRARLLFNGLYQNVPFQQSAPGGLITDCLVFLLHRPPADYRAPNRWK